MVCSSGLESQYHTFSKVEGQDCHYIQELEHQLHTSLDFKACSLREEKEKQFSHCNVIRYDEPPKSKGKKKRTEKTLGPHSASSYSSTHDYHFPQQQFQLDHGFRVPLYEPHLPCRPSQSLSSLGLSSVSGTSRSRESGNSRFFEPGSSRFFEPGSSRFREPGTSRFREPGTSRESSSYKSEQQRKHQRTKKDMKVAVKYNAAMEAPYT